MENDKTPAGQEVALIQRPHQAAQDPRGGPGLSRKRSTNGPVLIHLAGFWISIFRGCFSFWSILVKLGRFCGDVAYWMILDIIWSMLNCVRVNGVISSMGWWDVSTGQRWTMRHFAAGHHIGRRSSREGWVCLLSVLGRKWYCSCWHIVLENYWDHHLMVWSCLLKVYWFNRLSKNCGSPSQIRPMNLRLL